MTQQLGRLAPMDPRDVWLHEAHNFTPWLLDNADALAAVLGIDIELSAAEYPVGGFALDLIGRDLTNDCVLIVENQLTSTDHGHLGQILTYAAGTNAGTVVWMATSFREEDRQALDFLNGLGGEDVRFFGVEIGVVKIGHSQPAPIQAPGPAERLACRGRCCGEDHITASGEGVTRRSGLDSSTESRPSAHGGPMPRNLRLRTGSRWRARSKGGPYYGASFAQGGKLRNELYIDFGDAHRNTVLFESLSARKELVEGHYAVPLVWEDLPDKRACRIADYTHGDVINGDQFDHYIDWFFDSGTRLRTAIDAAASLLMSAGEILTATYPRPPEATKHCIRRKPT